MLLKVKVFEAEIESEMKLMLIVIIFFFLLRAEKKRISLIRVPEKKKNLNNLGRDANETVGGS